jgi:uncharacterized protein (DUF433 family)
MSLPGFPEGNAMKTEILIVDRGRGPQLSTSRITVQDLVPYFQDGCSYEEIMRWIPTLTHEEIRVIERYIQEHREEVMEQDRRIRERNATRRRPPEVERILEEGKAKLLALKERLLRAETNGEAK